jgi:hypothetical protein
VPIFFRRRRIAKTASGPVGPYILHSGIGGLPETLSGRCGCVYLIRFRRPPRPFLGRSGRAYLIPAPNRYLDRFGAGWAVYYSFWRRKSPDQAGLAVFISFQSRRVTQNTFRPVRLRLPHSGVEGHQGCSGAGHFGF